MESTTFSDLELMNTTLDDGLDNMTLTSMNMTTTPAALTIKQMLAGFPEAHAAVYINHYYLILVLVLGFPGNILSFITIVQMPPLTSSTVYVAFLSMVDNAAILVKVLMLYLSLNHVSFGAAGCKIMYFLGNFTVWYSNWILVGLTIERFCAIWFPLKVGAYCSKKNAFVMMAILAVAVAGMNMIHLFTSTERDGYDLRTIGCGQQDRYREFVEKIWFVVDGAFYAILPCILIVVFNILVIIGVKRSGRIQKDLTNNKMDQMAEKIRQQRQITFMLTIVCTAFLILVLPNCLYFVIKPYVTFKPGSHQHAVSLLMEQVIYFLSDVTHAINFYLYFLSGKKFRRRAIDILRCRKQNRRAFTSMNRTTATNVSNTSIYTTSLPNGAVNGKTQ